MSTESSTPKKRGPYRRGLTRKIPRQTLFNRRRKTEETICGAAAVEANDYNQEPHCDIVQEEDECDADYESDGKRVCVTPTAIHTDASPICTAVTPHEPDAVQPHFELTARSKSTLDLYPDSAISLDASQLMIRSYIDRHHLCGQAKTDLFQLLSLHLPTSSVLPNSLYLFQKQFCNDTVVEPQEYFYCSSCHMPTNEYPFCQNSFCLSSLSQHMTVQQQRSFVVLSIEEQLKALLKRKSLKSSITYRYSYS